MSFRRCVLFSNYCMSSIKYCCIILMEILYSVNSIIIVKVVSMVTNDMLTVLHAPVLLYYQIIAKAVVHYLLYILSYICNLHVALALFM